MILGLDEIDKATRVRRGADGDDVDPRGSAVRASRQATLLQLLWGETPITYKAASGVHVAVRTDHWTVLLLGAFVGASWVRPGALVTDDNLIEWGMTPEFAGRITQRWVLEPRSISALADILKRSRDGVQGLTAAVAGLGFRLVVEPEALRLLARDIVDEELTLRTAVGHLTGVVLDRVARLLQDDETPEGVIQIRPDDLIRSALRRGRR